MSCRKARDCPALGPTAFAARQGGYSFHKSPSESTVILPFLWRRTVVQRMSGKARLCCEAALVTKEGIFGTLLKLSQLCPEGICSTALGKREERKFS